MRTSFRTTLLIIAFAIGLLVAWAPGLLRSAESREDLDGFIASLAGGWSGENNTTPMGQMPFAALFQWEEDGSLHAHSALNRETYIDMRFKKDAEGRWILTEEAAMEGLGSHGYSLTPAEAPRSGGNVWRWVYPEDPEFLPGLEQLFGGDEHVPHGKPLATFGEDGGVERYAGIGEGH